MAEGQKAADSVEQKGVEKTPAAAAELGIIGGQRNQEVHDTAHAVSHAYDKTPSELDMVAIRDGETKAQFEARVKSIQENRCVFFDSDEESGSAEETGLVTDYCPVSTGEKSYSLGMDYEEGRDTRSGFEKLADCVRAAGQRAADPKGQQAYIQGQLDKIIGICEGLNIAKEQTKAGSVAGFKALADGTVANFLSKPNAVNDPLFNAVVGALDAMSKNPNAVNHALEHLGIIIMEGSERYTAAPNLEKGHIIGETMFAMVNPEGRMEAGEATLKVANQVAGRVDDAVLKSVQQAFRSAEEMAASFPQQAEKIRERLYDSLKMQFALTPQELEYAGIPKGYFDGIQPPRGAEKGNNYFAMSKTEEGEGIPNRSAHNAGAIQYRIDKATGRLQRTDLGKVREPYDWEALDEQFSSTVVRQVNEDSCISAVGEMLSEGKITQQQLITSLDKRPDITDLVDILGTGWTSEKRRFNSLAEIGKDGSWAAEIMENSGTELEKSLHSVVVDGVDSSGNLIILDPWEGTTYKMTPQQFLKDWTTRAVYRKHR